MCGTLVPGPADRTGESTCVARWFQGQPTGLVSLHVWYVGSRAGRPDWSVYMCGTLVPGPAALTGESTCLPRWFQGQPTGLVSVHVWHVGSRASRLDW